MPSDSPSFHVPPPTNPIQARVRHCLSAHVTTTSTRLAAAQAHRHRRRDQRSRGRCGLEGAARPSSCNAPPSQQNASTHTITTRNECLRKQWSTCAPRSAAVRPPASRAASSAALATESKAVTPSGVGNTIVCLLVYLIMRLTARSATLPLTDSTSRTR